MSCAECEALRGQLARARDLLAMWEPSEDAPADLERLAQWRRAFGVGNQVVAALMLLADAREGLVPAGRIVAATRRLPGATADLPHRTLAPVIMLKARQALDRLSLGGAIDCLPGLGWWMPLGAREKVLALVGEPS